MRDGVERNQELSDGRIYLDARRFDQRVADALLPPDNMRKFFFIVAALGCVLSPLIPLLFFILLGFWVWWKTSIARHRLPVRYPAHVGLTDPSEADDNMGKRNGSGIEFMGVERKGRTVTNTEEIWASNSDVRTHRIIMGTTGAGKTETLLSTLFNPLCWGSGFSMTDGKAQIDVTAKIFVMAGLFWREDDVLVLNYMRGGADRMRDMVNKLSVGVRRSRVSNTWNPFAQANHETINQILDSILDKASGDGAQWQGKAINMKNAVVQTLSYLRANGTIMMSISAIREYMSLDNLVKLALRNDIPPVAANALRQYLSVGLPGFSWAKAKAGKPQDSETGIQHGYLTGQFARTMGLMTDTYNDIFGDDISEYDTSDVILNNRISMTMIPTLEKGTEEAGNLGKMQVASAKMMMAENLGYELEGIYDTVVDDRPTNTDRPFYMVMDELGYYFAPGIDLMFAQGRSLNIALTAAGQDFQAMAKDNKNEVESMIANTRFKIAMKLEDPKETFDIFDKAAGMGEVAKLGGFDANEGGIMGGGGYKNTDNLRVESVSRISLQELKRLGPGDGVMISGSKVIRFRGFNLFMKLKFDKKKADIRINTFVPIDKPESFGAIASKCKPADNAESVASRLVVALSSATGIGGNVLDNDVLLTSVHDAANAMDGRNISPMQRGIVLFTALARAMDAEKKNAVASAVAGTGEASGSNRPLLKSKLVAPTQEPDENVEDDLYSGMSESPLSWVNEPPIEKRIDINNFDLDDLDNEDNMSFGYDPGKNEPRIGLTTKTKDIVRSILTGIAGGPGAIDENSVTNEFVATNMVIDKACSFSKTAAIGNSDDPVANSNVDDLVDVFTEIDRMLE